MIKFVIIFHKPSDLQWPNKCVKWGSGRNCLYSIFQFLIWHWSLQFLQGHNIDFGLIIMVSVGEVPGALHLDFHHVIILTPWVRETIWVFCQWINISITAIYSESSEITIGCILSPTIKHIQSQTPKHLKSTDSLLSVDNSSYFGCLGKPYLHSQYLTISRRFAYFLFSSTITLINYHKTLGGRFMIHMCSCIAGFFLDQGTLCLWSGLWLWTGKEAMSFLYGDQRNLGFFPTDL